jgi:hypothetical protein
VVDHPLCHAPRCDPTASQCIAASGRPVPLLAPGRATGAKIPGDGWIVVTSIAT